MAKEKLQLSSPWQLYYKALTALFKEDDQVKLFFDEDSSTIKVHVEDEAKANALVRLLPAQKKFGNITINIDVISSNNAKHGCDIYDGTIYDVAFNRNGAYRYSKTYQLCTNSITYVVFKHTVVQYYSDDLGDIHGLTSTLYQNIAAEVLEPADGVYYCTDVNDSHLWMPKDSGIVCSRNSPSLTS